MMVFYVAAGGALGAVARYSLGVLVMAVLGSGFPYATLLTNILGSLLMGMLIETFALIWNPGAAMQVFLTTGFLAAFTTFSTFSLDFVTLYERGDITGAFFYLVASILLSVIGLFAGLYLIRFFSG